MNGKDLGAACPKLKQRGHGVWQVRQELLAHADGRRNTWRRSGFSDKNAAQAALDRVRELLNLAEGDDEDGRVVTAMLMALGQDEALPEVETVRKRLRAQAPLNDKGTLGAWLLLWLEQERQQGQLRRATMTSYESHVRLYLIPKIGHLRRDRVTVADLVGMFAAIEAQNLTAAANNEIRCALTARARAATDRETKTDIRRQLDALPPFRKLCGKRGQAAVLATLRTALNDLPPELLTYNPAEHHTIGAKKVKPVVWTRGRVERWSENGQRPATVMVWTPELAGAFLDYVAERAPEYEAMWHLMI